MVRFAKNILTLLILGFVLNSFKLEAATNRIYIAVSGENRIAVYDQNETSGKLVHLNDIKINGSPKTLALSPDKQYLFVSISEAGKLASFKLNHKNGEASPLREVDTGAHASFFQLDTSGRFLVSAYYSLGKVRVHQIENGVISVDPLQAIETDERPHSVAIDPSNRFLFVPHTRPNAIFQFLFDRDTGHLTSNKSPRMQRTETVGPRHFRFDAQGMFGYCSNEQGDSVSTYRLNPETGRLTLLQTLTTLPAGFEGTNATSDLQIHPNGNFVYVANRGHDTLAAYSVDKNSGELSFIDWFPCEAATRSFAISNDGRFLYAAGSRSNKLATFSVNANTGRLTKIDTLDVGKNLWWVLFEELS